MNLKSFSGKGAEPLDSDDPYYVKLLEESSGGDPIVALWKRIKLAESESVHLLTGFRGNGKSTQLRRLKRMLEEDPNCIVLLVDMLDYVFMTKPISISDFILSLMAALASYAEDFSVDPTLKRPIREYADRVFGLLKSTRIEIEDIRLKTPLAELGMKLKTDDSFKHQVQQQLEGRLTEIVYQAREFVTQVVEGLRAQKNNSDLKVILLVDSLEQLRGMGEDAYVVHDSVKELFFGQASNLTFPLLHIVYSVPPYLPVLDQNPGRALGGNPITQWPNIHVRKKDGTPDRYGLGKMIELIEKRFPNWTDVISKRNVTKFSECSGGDIRNFFQLLREAALSLMIAQKGGEKVTLDNSMVNRVIQQLKNELLPLAEEDAGWLAKIHKSKEVSLPNEDMLADLARLFDSNRIMNYQNGEPWYDIHPLLISEIESINVSDG